MRCLSRLRNAGAFFIKRSGAPGSAREVVTDKKANDKTYRMLLETYVAGLVRSAPMLEVFLEGTRSRSGKTLSPKYGMLGMVTQTVLQRQIPDAYIVPVTINYEKVLELGMIVEELKGKPKKLESFGGTITGGYRALQQNFGSVKVCFGDAVSLQETIANAKAEAEAEGAESFEPESCEKDRKALDRHLALDVIKRLHEELEVSPTALVSTLLLDAPAGLSWNRLTHQVDWLSGEVRRRGGRLLHSKLCGAEAARKGVNLLGDHVHWNADVGRLRVRCESAGNGQPRHDRTSALMVGYYRNTLLHLFSAEAFVASILGSFGQLAAVQNGVPVEQLVPAMETLCQAFRYEFVGLDTDLERVVEAMRQHGVICDAEPVRFAASRHKRLPTQTLCFLAAGVGEGEVSTELRSAEQDARAVRGVLLVPGRAAPSAAGGVAEGAAARQQLLQRASKAASRGADGACLTPAGGWGQVAASNAGLLHSQIYSAVSTRAFALPPAL